MSRKNAKGSHPGDDEPLDSEASPATAARKEREANEDEQARREQEAEAQEAREAADAEGGTPVTGYSSSELDPRRVEGSNPALKAASESGAMSPGNVPPAAVAEKPRERKASDIQWADDLIDALAETGTGQDKLNVIRAAKLLKFNLGEFYGLPAGHADRGRRTSLPEDDPKRHLTAKQALQALEDDETVGEGTKQKARSICRCGSYTPAPPAADRIDARIPRPKGAPPKDDDDGDRPKTRKSK